MRRGSCRSLSLAVLLCSALLTACSTTISVPDETGLSDAAPSDWVARKQALLAFDQWTLRGKIAVRQGGQSETAALNQWQQDRDAYQLQLSSAFLGLGSVKLQGNTSRLLIQTGSGERYLSGDPEALIYQVTGWRLPLSALAYWVRGIPAPGLPSELGFGPDGKLRMLSQSGWDVHFERYNKPLEQRPPLPGLITATHGEARVRLAITQWSPLHAAP